MLIGIVVGVAAGALWGLTFIAPVIALPYAAFDLTAARYLAFGLMSVALLLLRGTPRVAALRRSDWLLLAWLGFAGNVGYFLLMALAVECVGAGLVALIVGCLPVVLALVGNRGPHRVPLRRLVVPLALLLVGLALVNIEGLRTAVAGAGGVRWLAGVLLAFAAMALWAAYAVGNDRALAARPGVGVVDWTILTGLGTLAALLPLLPIGVLVGLSAVPTLGLFAPGAKVLLFWGVVLGALSTFASTWAWSFATRRLPVALTGQLIVSETLFALLYEAMLRGHLPGYATQVGAALMLGGVVLTVRRFTAARSGEPVDGKRA